MADEDHAPAFWSSVAATFKDNPAVLFDLYNEPRVTPECELAGCTATSDQGVPYRTAGMQELVNTVRGAEAANVILIEGTHWGGDLTGWLANEPNDPAHNLAASWHTYNFASCNTPGCWSAEIAALAARVPVITGEVGENDGGATYFNALLPWLDAHGISYLAWSWVTPGIDNVWALIADFQSGAPTAYGQAYHDHLASVVAEHRAPVVVPARPSPETTATATPAAVAPPRSRPPRTGLE